MKTRYLSLIALIIVICMGIAANADEKKNPSQSEKSKAVKWKMGKIIKVRNDRKKVVFVMTLDREDGGPPSAPWLHQAADVLAKGEVGKRKLTHDFLTGKMGLSINYRYESEAGLIIIVVQFVWKNEL